MSETTYSQEDIDNVKAALKQVFGVNPQLLFEAIKSAGVDYQMDIMKEQFTEKPSAKKLDTYRFRCAMMLELGRLLIQSGRAKLNEMDMVSVMHFLQARAKAESSNE